MNAVDPARVRDAFDAADGYDTNARVQRRVARSLAERMAAIHLPDDAYILEIGCGTGFLTRAARDTGVGGRWLVTDKAPRMVERCRAALGQDASLSFAVLDGEYGIEARSGPFDLVCASMAMQWFDDLGAAIPRLIDRLAPGGHLLFNTLAAETFAEWRMAHRACGVEPGALPFPQADDLLTRFKTLGARDVTVERHVDEHRDARQFLASVKAIGAGTATRGHRPLPPADFKRVMARFDASGSRATYEVVTCHFVREAA